MFGRLSLWQDRNHDGVSRDSELHLLPELGVRTIGLRYQKSNRLDRYGNRFRLRAPVTSSDPRAARWAWDVFLASAEAARDQTGPRRCGR